MTTYPRLAFLAFALLLASAATGVAHDPGLSSTLIKVRTDGFETVLHFNPLDLRALLEEAHLPGALTSEDIASRQPELTTLAQTAVRLTQDSHPLEPRAVSVSLGENKDLAFHFHHPRNASRDLRFESLWLERIAPGHRQLFTLGNYRRLLSAQDASITVPLSETPIDSPTPSSFGSIVYLGIEHILTGWDHLLFLAGLLIVCIKLGDALALVTLFTIAHSFSLALAALGVLTVSPRIVEPLIAASIVFVGLENLFSEGAPTWRRPLTLAFGLVHGLGFAGALAEVSAGASGWNLLGTLFGFNLGVEIGQIGVAALVLPTFLLLRRLPRYSTHAVPAFSCAIALMGAIWLIERVLPTTN